MSQYHSYIDKSQNESTSLLQKIIDKTMGLQTDFALSISMGNGNNDTQYEESKMNEITLGNRVLDEVILFYQGLHRFVIHFYGTLMQP